MEDKKRKKSFLLFIAAFALITLGAFGLSYRATRPVPALISGIEPQNRNENTVEARTENQKPNAGKNRLDGLAASQKELFAVERVIDGDTIVVNINGEQTHIRLIGINSPELHDRRTQVACLAQKAKSRAEELLDGKKIFLEQDPTQGDYDKYGRLLAYIFLEDGSTRLTTSGTSFNKLMIEDGYAYQYTYRLPYKYQREFKKAEQQAKASEKGLWAPGACGN